MHICFILDTWDSLEETESSLRIVHEAYVRQHTVAIIQPQNLTIRDNVTYAFCDVLQKAQKVSDNISIFRKKIQFKKQLLPLKGFDVIFLRKNPPLDSIMLNFLDSVKDEVFIVNSIDGLRKANNKIYVTTFEDSHELIPETYVSKNAEYLYELITNFHANKMILKPLAGHGGKGVIIIEKNARHSIRSLLDFYIGEYKKNYVILQEYIEGAEEGDIRVIMLNGESIGAMRRLPGEGDIRANIHAGGHPEKYHLNKKEQAICHKIGKKLVEDGLYLVGLDLMQGKILEVNVVSPGGIARINQLNKTKLQKKILDFVEGIYHKKTNAMTRRQEFRKVVGDA